ncbi:hypothetical protein ACT7DO_08275 [Bacillus pacificus]
MLNDKLTNDEQGILRVLLDSLNGITGYVDSELYNGECPVCTTPMGASLKNTIEKNRVYINANLYIQTSYAERLLELKTMVMNSTVNLRNSLSSAKENINILRSELKYSFERLTELKK